MSRPFVLGLTGSIGMGKTTTAEMFREEGVPVWDADAAVAKLYEPGGRAAEALKALRPDAVRSGAVDRDALKSWIGEDEGALAAIESVVHPLVAEDRRVFVEKANAQVVLLDIPLLFETGADGEVDAVVVVTAPEDVQRERVLSRPDMNEEMFSAIRARQWPDAEKRARADYIVHTVSMDGARSAVRQILKDVRARANA